MSELKITDLRNGNILEHNNSIVFVDGYRYGTHNYNIYFTLELDGAVEFFDDIANFTPIPLTEDWLKRFGFEKVNHIYGYSFWTLDKFEIQNHQTLYRGTRIEHCEFVHQLQNAFRWIKGKELELQDEV